MSDTVLAAAIGALVGRIANIAPPMPDADIYAAGFASTDALELLVELEDAHGIVIPDGAFIEARTTGDLARLVTSLQSGGT
jgi:acyl carrier protein